MWYASDSTVSAGNPRYFADGSFFAPAGTTPQGSRTLEVYDKLNGSVYLAWPTLTNPVDSFNVYVNGVLNQRVFNNGLGPGGFSCTVTGLKVASYNGSVKTAALTYDFKVVAVYKGVEVVATLDRIVTPHPDSVMLKTPMKRLWPFPNTGLD
jgi:hypothetical protein